MATMKKATKTAAVKEGTYYECGWCGQEGTNAKYTADSSSVVCGRMVVKKYKSYCSEKCLDIYSLEHNRRQLIAGIDKTNEKISIIKEVVAQTINCGGKIDPVILQIAKLINIYKKVLVLVVSGDKSSARKLYNEKKDIVTDCAEDMLANEEWKELYMPFINRFAELDGLLNGDCSF